MGRVPPTPPASGAARTSTEGDASGRGGAQQRPDVLLGLRVTDADAVVPTEWVRLGQLDLGARAGVGHSWFSIPIAHHENILSTPTNPATNIRNIIKLVIIFNSPPVPEVNQINNKKSIGGLHPKIMSYDCPPVPRLS